MGAGDVRELAIRVPAGIHLHRAHDLPRPSPEPRVAGHGLRHGGIAPADRGQARRARRKGRQVMSDKTITEEKVRKEHLGEVNPAAHWAYLVGVLVGSTVLMIAFI